MNRVPYSAARPYTPDDRQEWLRMRLQLWPEMDAETHLVDMEAWLATLDTAVCGLPRGSAGRQLAVFAEVGTRSVADSCETSPVGYLEGWFVDPDMRREGVG